MEKQLQICSYEQAEHLKNLGFDWECDFFFDGSDLKYAGSQEVGLEDDILSYQNWNHKDLDWNDGVQKPYTSAPTVALALKWIRDVKKYLSGIDRFFENKKFRYVICHIEKNNNSAIKSNGIFDTYEAAESALLDELLTLL